jgi:lysophospholipase L1-like esterase
MLCAVEVSLRLAGWYLLRSRARAIEAQMPAGGYRILFLGESTTYGLWVEPADAYPAQVAAQLEAKHPASHFLAFNRGVPSITTSAILRTLPEKLRLVSPQLVVILAGVNDFQTRYNGVHRPGEGWLPRPIGDAVGNLRIYRLVSLWIDLRNPKVKLTDGTWTDQRSPPGMALDQKEVFYDDGGAGGYLLADKRPGIEKEIAAATTKLEENLTQMIALSRASGAQVIVMGYLRAPPETAILERVAQREGVPFVPTWLPSDGEDRPASLFFEDHFHPTKEGHRRMADRLVEGIERSNVLAATRTN